MTKGLCTGLAMGVTVLVLAGCGGGEPEAASSPTATATASPAAGSPAATTSPTATPAATPAAPVAKDGTDLKACRDGTCEVKVRSGQRIPLADRFGTGPVSVTVEGTSVTFRFSHGGAGGAVSSDTASGGGGATLNGVHLKATAAGGETVIVKVSHG